jgi:hypothetical protein
MDENYALDYFSQQKIITLEQLIGLLECSAITARRRLKQWQTYTSINKNGRYYTLPQIPEFDQSGLWRYQTVLFSKHGNHWDIRCRPTFHHGSGRSPAST